jgi:alcohol dehydrogenase
MLPMIAVPTTAGTGSEVQSFALIADAETHQKMACGDKKVACRVAILDPELTVSQPPLVTAMTGMDAIAHAVETCVTKRRSPISDLFSREAWRLLQPSFPRVLADPADLEARGRMLLGACFAGVAIEHSMLGATHACANPLTAHHGVAHGAAISVMLPHVIRFNGLEVRWLYDDLLRTAGLANGTGDAAGELADRVGELRDAAGLPGRLSDYGVTAEELPMLAAEAARQWTAGFNPRAVGEKDLLELYRCAL